MQILSVAIQHIPRLIPLGYLLNTLLLLIEPMLNETHSFYINKSDTLHQQLQFVTQEK